MSRRHRATRSKCPIGLASGLQVGALALLSAVGCDGTPLEWRNPFLPRPEPVKIADADTGFTDPSLVDSTPLSASAQPRVIRVNLSILHVKVPHSEAATMEMVWNHLREDMLDRETQRSLQDNGLRVGSGHVDDWEPIKAVFDSIEGVLVNQVEPVRLPEWVPLDLELDLEPTPRMIFFLDRQGDLSGASYPDSRKIFKIAHAVDRRHADRIHLQMMPEVRQSAVGKRWIRTPIGISEVATYSGRQYPELAFKVELLTGQFLVLAPGQTADVEGLIGRVFLTETFDNQQFDSYIFIRPAVEESAPRS